MNYSLPNVVPGEFDVGNAARGLDGTEGKPVNEPSPKGTAILARQADKVGTTPDYGALVGEAHLEVPELADRRMA